MAEPIYDDPEDLAAVKKLLLSSERLEAIIGNFHRSPDPGEATGSFQYKIIGIAVTSRRLIIKRRNVQEHRRVVHRHDSEYMSIPFSKVMGIKMQSNSSNLEEEYTHLYILTNAFRDHYEWESIPILGEHCIRAIHDMILNHLE